MGIYGKYENGDEWLEAFGKAIRKHRIEKNLAERFVAAELRMGRDTIRAVELGRDSMRLDLFLKLASYVGYDLCCDMNDIGRRIAAYRVYRGKTQQQLADESFLSKRPIQQIEAHGKSMYMNTFLCICEALDVAPMKLLKKDW